MKIEILPYKNFGKNQKQIIFLLKLVLSKARVKQMTKAALVLGSEKTIDLLSYNI